MLVLEPACASLQGPGLTAIIEHLGPEVSEISTGADKTRLSPTAVWSADDNVR